MPGLVPGIHVFLAAESTDVDGRDKPGHDAESWCGGDGGKLSRMPGDVSVLE
jgi:hypothetical protein